MALQKDKVVKGFTANYHKIIEVQDRFKYDKVRVMVGLYKDAAARAADVNDHIEINNVELDLVPGEDRDRADIYAELKTLDDWDGATDV